jgi:hypothetical protein
MLDEYCVVNWIAYGNVDFNQNASAKSSASLPSTAELQLF